MPRSAVQRALLQAGRLVLSEATAAESTLISTAGKAGRAFSSVAGRGIQSQLTRGATTQLGAKCRCSCGRIMCMGNHNNLHTTAGQAAADAALADEAPHAPSLTAR